MATNHDMPFLLDKKDVVFVKPSSPTPSGFLSVSTIDNDFNLEILCVTVYVYQARTDYPPNGSHDRDHSDPASVLKEALSRVLVYYYPLAGKFKRHSDGNLRVNCNAEGVPFLEATVDCELSSLHYLDGIDVETGKQFAFDLPADEEDGYHPLFLQVTKFSCGGFTIGMGMSHSVADGFGGAQFFRSLAELACGKSEPSVKPVWERERLKGTPGHESIQFPFDASSFSTSPHWPTTDLVHECFNVRSETINKLKKSLTNESAGKVEALDEISFTAIEALGAYIWRSRFRALEMNPDGKTMFVLAVGIRQILNPPLSNGYYGNAFVSSNAVLTGRDLIEGPLSRVAKAIKESKRIASSKEFVLNSLNFLETLRHLNIKMESNPACLVLTDWRRLSLLEEVDFGWKGALNVVPFPWNTSGYVDLCILLPPCGLDGTMKGGVKVLVTLPGAAMAKFKQEMNAL